MQCSHCGKCCKETEMELSSRDIERLEKVGYNQEEFTVIGKDDVIRLRNNGKFCYFYSVSEKRCRVYGNKPLGCHIYPVVYSINKGVIIDKLCPVGKTISKKELRIKGKILLKILTTIDKEKTKSFI